MEIETVEDWLGVYGACKSESPDGCEASKTVGSVRRHEVNISLSKNSETVDSSIVYEHVYGFMREMLHELFDLKTEKKIESFFKK